jgi:hypothetical protein
MIPDIVNGAFETCGAVASVPDIHRLRRDKNIRGVYWPTRIFFLVWGFWNLFYYPSLSQWYSFSGGVALTIANTIWCYLAFRYRQN